MSRAAGSGRAADEGDTAPDLRAVLSLTGLILGLCACFVTALGIAQTNPHLATLLTTATP